ncbi:hypothetical protein [Bilophila wadsworthia]|mgnify:FL=1|uniref:hypothetical protein n=1 Tax=Bilophila wadsworthia TaxID=35833 RepID=UPI0026DCF3A2|nr:hypothetical protein [Bilophila wadsworthia]
MNALLSATIVHGLLLTHADTLVKVIFSTLPLCESPTKRYSEAQGTRCESCSLSRDDVINCDIRIGDVVEVIRSPEGKPERLRVELPFRPRVAQPFADMELCYGR